MNRNTLLRSSFLLTCMLLLILDTKTALIGAKDGIALCLTAVIPSLFPFLFLSIAIKDSLTDTPASCLRPIAARLGIPPGAESVLIASYLGGYPVGAQCVTLLYQNSQLSRKDAEHLLAFCNNAGPAFLFGMVGSFFPTPSAAWCLWAIHILGSLFAAYLFFRVPENTSIPEKKISRNISPKNDWLKISIHAMSSICGWVILFRVLLAFLSKWLLWFCPLPIQVILCGILELTNGCLGLSYISDLKLRFIVANMLLSLGGLCVTMQTISVTSGLSLRFYFTGKIIQFLFSVTAACFLAYGNPVPLIVFFLFFLIAKRKNRKSSSIPKVFVV